MKLYQINVYHKTGANRGNIQKVLYADTIKEARQIRAETSTGEACNSLNSTIFEWSEDKYNPGKFDYYYKEG